MSISDLYQETLSLPRALRFPLELLPPEGFDAERLETWPRLPGRLEYVEGRLLYMPPCGDLQQDTVADVTITLGSWVRAHLEFVLGTNEAGMRLGGSTRGADAAVWRRRDLGSYSGGLRRVPPVLAVEVAGDESEPESLVREKARWYLAAGVQVVWLLLPATREVIVLTPDGEQRCRIGQRLAPSPLLPDLAPSVDELFSQISRH